MGENRRNNFRSYEIPLGRVMGVVFFLAFITTLLIILIASITANRSFLVFFDSLSEIVLFGIVFVAVLIGVFLFNEFSEGIDAYFIKKWILKNIRCPRCNTLFTICEYDRGDFSFRLRQSRHPFGHVYSVYCKYCEKEYYLEQRNSFSKTLKFTGESYKVQPIEIKRSLSLNLNKENIIISSTLAIVLIIFISIAQQIDYCKYGGYTLERVDWYSRITPKYLVLTRIIILVLIYLAAYVGYSRKKDQQSKRNNAMGIVLFSITYYIALFSFLYFYCNRFFSDIIVIKAGVITVGGILFYLGMYFILFERKKKE